MLKITIDNEEVLSNKDFTIEEEMLNTPSVILDNVYPKSWENDKDYVTRFYHPNDYSKCLIKDEDYTPAEPGLNEEGTNFQITADTTKLNELTSIKGNTTQSGTPTPSSPQPINVVSGRQEVSVVGKNLFNPAIQAGTYKDAVYTIDEDGKINQSYTDNSEWNRSQKRNFYLEAGTYTIRIIGKETSQRLQVRNLTDNENIIQTTDNVATFTLNGVKLIALKTWGPVSTYPISYYIELEKGSTATEYEAYNGNTYEINLGKNLIPFSDIISTGGTTSNGITFTLQADGTIKANGTATAGVSIYLTTNYIEQKAGTYTLSDGIASGQSSTTFFLYADVRHLDETPWDIKYFSTFETTTRTRTIEEAFKFKPRIVIRQGQVLNDLIFKPQLEKGSQATTYAPYKTPIELCKIGDYQDKIAKSTGKNLFDKSTLTTSAYLKEDGTLQTGTGAEYVTSDFIPVKPNTTYYKTLTLSPRTKFYDKNKQVLDNTTYQDVSIGGNAGSFTTPSNAYYFRFTGNVKTSTGININLTMVNEGSTALDYEPYGKVWYLNKQIGKVVLDGSEEWKIGGTYSGITQFDVNANTTKIPETILKVLSNYFRGVVWKNSWTINKCISIGLNIIRIMTSDYTTVADFKAWLSTHNTIVYYVLKEPTYTEITDTELISQLESIKLLEGLNNVSVVSPYLQGIINIHYNYVNETTTSDLLFCGVVKNSGNISLNPRYPHYQTLQILDFKTFLSEGETLDFVIANKTIEEAIDQIISTIAPYGFVKGNIQIIGADTIIGAYSTKDKTAYDVFNYIADITQSRWTTRLIDENTVAIDFYDPTLLPQGTPINYNETWFRDNLIDDMSYSYGSNDYRNKQVMTSNEVYGSILQTQTMVANGYQTQFDTELKIGQITSITANGTQLTIATNEQKELGFNADIYYTPGNNYFESADLRSTGEILIVNYIAIVEGRQIITNGTEINRVATATGRKGIVARYENRNDANTSNELQLIGQSYIRYKGTPEIKLTIVSRKNLWNIGDRVQFNAPISELATEYMVKKKTINRILANPSSEEHIVYTYEMTSSFNSEQAINYFDNQRAKAKGNIGQGEYITRNVDIENVANIIFYGSNVEQATITGDNTLQATLSSPIIN